MQVRHRSWALELIDGLVWSTPMEAVPGTIKSYQRMLPKIARTWNSTHEPPRQTVCYHRNIASLPCTSRSASWQSISTRKFQPQDQFRQVRSAPAELVVDDPLIVQPPANLLKGPSQKAGPLKLSMLSCLASHPIVCSGTPIRVRTIVCSAAVHNSGNVSSAVDG